MNLTIPTFLPLLAIGLGCPTWAQGSEGPSQDFGLGLLPPNAPRSFSVRDLMDAPLVDPMAEPGAVWARGRNQRLRFGNGAIEVLPIFGPGSTKEWPVRIAVLGATIGGEALNVAPTGDPAVHGTTVVQPRAALKGVHHLRTEGFEQTFVFDTLPARGELSLTLSVETELDVEVKGDSLSFVHPGLGHVEVGTATAIDGQGHRTSVERRWTGDGIEIVVPADFVEAATLPLTIDPVWTTFSMNFGVQDDGQPDIVFAGESQRYVVIWEELTSQTNRDVYATYYDETLSNRGNAIAIDMTSADWTAPAVGYGNRDDRILVAASVGLGTGLSRVMGRLVNVGSFTPFGASFIMSSIGGGDRGSVDVGGSNAASAAQANFAVVWSREMAPGDSNIEHRIVRSDGSFASPITIVDGSDENDIQVAVSQGLGDTDLLGDNWHLVWTREGDNQGRGELWCKRLHFTGLQGNSSDPFLVDSSGDYAHPSVSSLFDAEDTFTGSRGAIVVAEAFKVDNLRPGGYRTDIEARLISDDDWNGQRIALTTMEDFDPSLLQTRPQVATDGRAFFVTYLEEEPTMINGGVWNVFMASGNTIDGSIRTSVALAERHIELAAAQASESAVSMTTRWCGETDSLSTDGAAIWSVLDPMIAGEYGAIEGAGFRYPLPGGSLVSAVGVQYGNALLTSPQDEATGWMRIIGTQDRAIPQLAQATDLPPNVFGFLLTSREPGVVNHPGGSAGRLLLGGQIGRYVNQISPSGSQGRISFTIDSLVLPQGNGTASALVNETWHFQCWHRDVVNGFATSNLTNGVRITFKN